MAGSYDGSAISVKEGLDAVRSRPGMYIGSTDKVGLHHMIWEVLDNSIDEAMVPKSAGGCCDTISVTLNKDGSVTVKDNGRGIPVDMHEVGKPTIEVVMGTLHAGGKFEEGNSYKASGGLHGVGISVVNALSESTYAIVERGGDRWRIDFAYAKGKSKSGKVKMVPGKVTEPLRKVGKTRSKKQSGTEITFKPDPEVFSTTTFDDNVVRERMKSQSYLNPGVTLIFKDDRNNPYEEVFYSENGVIDLVEDITTEHLKDYNAGKSDDELAKSILPHPVFLEDDISSGAGSFSMSMQWVTDRGSTLLSYANSIHTTEGGVHLDGALQGVRRALNKLGETSGVLKDDLLELADIKIGMQMVLSATVNEPDFLGQTKSKLITSGYKGDISSTVFHAMWDWIQENPVEAMLIVEKGSREMALRKKISLAEINERKKSARGVKPSVNLPPSKLIKATGKGSKGKELFIVEGDSAANPATEGREPLWQAILPIRGKILNSLEAKNKTVKLKDGTTVPKVIANAEIQSIIDAIGAGTEDLCDISKSNYEKIIILTDADDDGAHISTLLMTMFIDLMRPLVEAGMIYVVRLPLYAMSHKGKKEFVRTKSDHDKLVKKYPNATWTRFKGLGEMNTDELSDTALNPDTRELVCLKPTDMDELVKGVNVMMTSNKEKANLVMGIEVDIEDVM